MSDAVKLLLDQGLPRSTIEHLRSLGIDAEHVADLGMSQSTDSDILAHAEANGHVVVTLDADFHSLLAASGDSSPSVVRLRIEGLKVAPLAAILNKVLKASETEVGGGAAVSVTSSKIRIHKLPIGSKKRWNSSTIR